MNCFKTLAHGAIVLENNNTKEMRNVLVQKVRHMDISMFL